MTMPILNGLIPPKLHDTGTSRAALLEQYTNALEALRKADLALVETAPNPGNFTPYPNPLDAFEAAQAQHLARRGMLAIIAREIGALAEDVAAQP